MNISSIPPMPSRRLFLQALATAGLGTLGMGLPLGALAAGGDSLDARVNAFIQGQRRSGRLGRDEETSWSVYDFSTAAKLVSINEEVPRQAASMIKPFVAQAYFYRHQESPARYPYTAEVERLMEAMIRYSANDATNEMIERSSDKALADRPREVERILRKHAGGIFRQVEIVEYIPAGGRTYLNKASARDYSRYLYALWNDSVPSSEQMKNYLGLPNRDRILHGTNGIPDVCKVLDKTGSTAHLCGNMGIVVAPGRDGKTYPYTLIGIIEKQSRPKDYGSWIRSRGDVIRGVSELVYSELRQKHRLV